MPLCAPSATATGHGTTWAMRSRAMVRAMRAWVLRGASAGSAGPSSRPRRAGHEAGPACDRSDHQAAWACDRNAEGSPTRGAAGWAPGSVGWGRGARYVTVRSAAGGGRWELTRQVCTATADLAVGTSADSTISVMTRGHGPGHYSLRPLRSAS